MGKALATAGAVIAGAALIATGIGAVAGAGLFATGFAGAGSWTLFGASLSTVSQIGAGLSLAGNLLTKRPEIQTGGSPTQQTYDPQAGIPYVMGRTAVGGRIIYGTTTGPAKEPNKYRSHYSILSGAGPVQAIESYSANNEAVTFGADSGEGASGTYLNRMWQVRRLGASGDAYLRFTATGTKDTPADHSGNPPEWTSAHLLGGYAVALTAMEFDAKVYAADVNPLWVLQGVKVYDPRLDSTYPGGSGACRALNEATYVYSANPWLHALTFALGRFQNGQRVLGFGFPIASLILSQFVEAANVADANGWVIGGTVYSTDDKWAAMQAMAQTGGGYCLPMGAQTGCVVNAPRVSLETITSADILGEASAAGTKGRRDRINRIIPRYRSEAHGWEMVAATPIEVASHVTEDGAKRRTREIDYPLVQAVNHAAQLARYDIENSRELEPITIRVGPRFLGYRPGDCITLDVPEIGLVSRDVVILRRSFDPASGTVSFSCRTETDAKHAFALGQTTTAPPTPGLTTTGYVPLAPDAADWAATGVTLTDNGQSIPAITVIGETADPHVGWLMVQYRPVGAADWINGAGVEIVSDAEVKVEITGLTRGTTYDVRIAFRSHRGVPGPWTVLADATSGDFSLDEVTAAFDDGALTPGEKLYVVPWIKAMIARRTGLRARADALSLDYGDNLERMYFEDAADELDTQVAALTAPVAWDNSSGLTTVSAPADLRGALEDAQSTADALQSQIDAAYGTLISDLDDQVNDLFAAIGDGQITTGEKLTLIPTINSLVFARSALRTRATAMGLTVGAGNAERIAFENAATALDSLLAGLTSPVAWNNTTASTTVSSPSSFRTALENAIKTERDLQTVIDGQPTGGAFGVNLTESSGGATATNANYKTGLGTASAILSQSLFATYGGMTPTQMSGKIQYFDPGDGKAYDYRAWLYNNSVDGTAGRYTQPLSAGVGSISVASHSVYLPGLGGVTTISIPATSFSGLSNDTAYTIFYRPDYGDWFPVVSSNAAPYKTSRDGYLEIGTISTPSGGGVWVAPTSDYTSTGLYSSFDCVDAAALLASGKRAGAAIPGDFLTMMAPGGDLTVLGRVNATRLALADCLTLRTDNGGQITVSRTAPIMTRDGPGYLPYAICADDCEPGMAIPTLGVGGEVIWAVLESLQPAGRRQVAMISADNGVYAAGDPGSAVLVFTHNIYNKA